MPSSRKSRTDKSSQQRVDKQQEKTISIPKYFVAALIVVIVGIASRMIDDGSVVVDKYLGDALYAVLIYLILRLLRPKQSATLHLMFAAILATTIETFQLTGFALEWRREGSGFLKLLSIALGTKFGWLDLFSYAVGLATAYWIDCSTSLKARSTI